MKSKRCNVGRCNEARIKNSLPCLAFNIINIDKCNGIVLMDKNDYIHTVEKFFGDSNKFKLITDDPTITRMKSLQNYLRKIYNRGELTKDEFNL